MTAIDTLESSGAIVIEPATAVSPSPQAITSVDDRGAFDAIIIGGGPAGITAGIYLARKMISTLLVSPDLGGQVGWTGSVENYPGYGVISGYDLAEQYKQQLLALPVNLRLGDEAVRIVPGESGGVIETAQGGKYRYRGLIIASGKRTRKLDVPGEEAFRGRGVTYCATCDGPLFRGETVAVVGGGNSALTAASDLLGLGCRVVLVNNTPGLQADAVLVARAQASTRCTVLDNHEVIAIEGGATVTAIQLRNLLDGRIGRQEVTGVFIEIGLVPNSGFAEGIVALNERGEILVDCRCATSAPGMFAAGDVTTVPDKQIVIAAGEGAKAALGLSDYLSRH